MPLPGTIVIKRILGSLAASTLLVLGCGDDPSPTQPTSIPATGTPAAQSTPDPTRTPTPNPLLAPIVTSAEPTTIYYGGGWIIRGSHFVPDPEANFESGSSVVRLDVEENTLRGERVGVTVPRGTAPGAYTPCVSTINGKGCGSFLVTVN